MTIRNTIMAISLAFSLMLPSVASSNPQNIDKQQIECLAEGVYYEAKSEPKAGKIAVGHVVMNRVKSKGFPKTVCEVIRQKSKGRCQFVWVCDKSKSGKNKTLYAQSFEVAELVYSRSVEDNTGGAVFFHSKRVKPSWTYRLRYTTKIGNHVFYKGI